MTAYKIGDYKDEVFDQTGALKSVMLNTPTVPSGLKTVLKNATVAAGGSDVDAGNPIGWVASRWLGYPTDPLSDDVTSAFSPYAGQLQLLAQELAKHTDALGTSAGSLPAGMFSTLMTETLPVSGPGLYLIVDSKQNEGGSLPIIVGSKVFNEALEDVVDGGMVDFADAGVKGKPRLGQAALKTSITDVAKRIVNDAGVDGFDVGAEVEFEVALRVPDLSSFTSVAYDSYKFNLTDVAASGLTLPVDGSGVEVFVDALSPTEPQSLPPGLIAVSGDTLSVDGLKVLFAESSGSGVKNKNTVPAGSLMRFRYAAVLNTTASFSAPGGGGLAPNANTVTLTRSTSDGDTEQKTASANAYSFKVDVVKVDKDDTSTALGDAKFEVSRDGQALKFTQVSAGVYRLDAVGGTEVTTHADGTLTLLGVEARELSFRETQAPDGYFTVSDFTVEVVPVWNADASEVTVASYRTGGTNLAYVSQDGRSVTVADPSKSLANLPYTGGVGILLLLIIGGVFLMVAVRPYYLSHRAEATANILM
ncbi:MAG: prealbumin-like fold domain-containing protein [Bifidobacterium crudilactis]|nr:prealbumin-like fold domain-containing protein [Bifidobacterium crudilactis]